MREASSQDNGEFVIDGLWGALGFLALAIFLANLLVLIYIVATHEKTSLAGLSVGDLITSSIGTWSGFLGGAYFVAKRRGTGSLRRDYGLKFNLKIDLPIGILSGVLLQLVVIPLLYQPLESVIPNLQKQLSGPANQITSSAHGLSIDTIVVGLIIVVGAPFAEEIFFRGLLLGSIGYKTRKMTVFVGNLITVVSSAIIFALAHVEPLQTLGLFAVGIVLAVYRIKLKRLGAGIVTHASFNLVTFIALVHR